MIYWLHLQITKLKKFERILSSVGKKTQGVTHTVNALKTHTHTLAQAGN